MSLCTTLAFLVFAGSLYAYKKAYTALNDMADSTIEVQMLNRSLLEDNKKLLEVTGALHGLTKELVSIYDQANDISPRDKSRFIGVKIANAVNKVDKIIKDI